MELTAIGVTVPLVEGPSGHYHLRLSDAAGDVPCQRHDEFDVQEGSFAYRSANKPADDEAAPTEHPQ